MNSITWQQGGLQPDNAENFATIAQWWQSLSGKEITWQQRLLPEDGNLENISWESQKFDEKLSLVNPEVRGITLYWTKPSAENESSTTPDKLELSANQQKLYIYPQSQKQLVIRVAIQEIAYSSIELNNPQIVGTTAPGSSLILLRDSEQQLEVKIRLSGETLAKLKTILSGS